MDFDTLIERCGTQSAKWDKMEQLFGVSSDDGLAMWTADSDYATAPCVLDALQAAVDHGVFGYCFEYPAYKDAVCWWMRTRHGWSIDPDWVLTTQVWEMQLRSAFKSGATRATLWRYSPRLSRIRNEDRQE